MYKVELNKVKGGISICCHLLACPITSTAQKKKINTKGGISIFVIFLLRSDFMTISVCQK